MANEVLFVSIPISDRSRKTFAAYYTENCVKPDDKAPKYLFW